MTYLLSPKSLLAGAFLTLLITPNPIWNGPVNADPLQAEPEAATGTRVKKLAKAKKFMIAAANPLAARAGHDILAKGGSALDAAIAAQLVLNLVEPQSSGIGGGAFILHWDKKRQKLKTYDGRETAPLAARPDRFLREDGSPMPLREIIPSGLSVGVPGLIRVLEMAHKYHGRLPWRDLFTHAIQLSEEGFLVSKRLHKLLQNRSAEDFGPNARRYFFDTSGTPWPVGHRLKNPRFAQTLRMIAEGGANAFYEGQIAIDIIERLKNAPRYKSDMTLADLKSYHAKERPPLCIFYRVYKICGMGPPSSGGLTVAQVLKLIEPFDLGETPLNTSALHLIAEAQKLSYADRNRYAADADFVPVPKGLLDEGYIAERRQLISTQETLGKAKPGNPPFTRKSQYGRDATIENSGTSHISVIDAQGNAVSMTTTIEAGFGSRMMVGGFLLNNELTDFSRVPRDKKGRLLANLVQPGKRSRSSMAPTIVFDKSGKVAMVVGSPGGSRIILYVLKTLIGHIDWGLDAQAAANLMNFGSRNGPFEMEPGTQTGAITRALQALGHKVRIRPMTSGVHAIVVKSESFEGGADPRREGLATGD